eukprot:gene10600-12266_t
MVIITNDSPRLESPSVIVEEINSGLPESIRTEIVGYAYNPLQDQGNCPLWFEPHLQDAQQKYSWHVMEDRFSAIRAAIGTAVENDVVIILGRGHKDFMEYGDEDGEIVRGWFDDRAEVRHALRRLKKLNKAPRIDRSVLPWGEALAEAEDAMGL